MTVNTHSYKKKLILVYTDIVIDNNKDKKRITNPKLTLKEKDTKNLILNDY